MIEIAGCKCVVLFTDETFCSLGGGGGTVVSPATARHVHRVHSEREV